MSKGMSMRTSGDLTARRRYCLTQEKNCCNDPIACMFFDGAVTCVQTGTTLDLNCNGMKNIGNIIPCGDNVYSLGTAAHRWRDVHVGPGSLYIGSITVMGEDTAGVAYIKDKMATNKVIVGSTLVKTGAATASVNGWCIGATGTPGTTSYDLIATENVSTGSGTTGLSYSLIKNKNYAVIAGPAGTTGPPGSAGPTGPTGPAGTGSFTLRVDPYNPRATILTPSSVQATESAADDVSGWTGRWSSLEPSLGSCVRTSFQVNSEYAFVGLSASPMYHSHDVHDYFDAAFFFDGSGGGFGVMDICSELYTLGQSWNPADIFSISYDDYEKEFRFYRNGLVLHTFVYASRGPLYLTGAFYTGHGLPRPTVSNITFSDSCIGASRIQPITRFLTGISNTDISRVGSGATAASLTLTTDILGNIAVYGSVILAPSSKIGGLTGTNSRIESEIRGPGGFLSSQSTPISETAANYAIIHGTTGYVPKGDYTIGIFIHNEDRPTISVMQSTMLVMANTR